MAGTQRSDWCAPPYAFGVAGAHQSGSRFGVVPRRVVLGLVALATLGLAVRVGWILAVDPDVPEVGDATAYHLLAEGLAGGDGYVRPFDRVLFDLDRPTAEYPPLHPAVLAAADAVGIDGVTGQRLWLSLIGAASVAATGALAWRLLAPDLPARAGRSGAETAAFVAAGVAAVHPLWFQADATLMPETVATLLGALVVLAALTARDRAPAAGWLVAGGVCGLAVLARAEAVLLLTVVLVATRSWRHAAVALGAAVLVVGPWTARNAARFDELVPVSTNIGSVLDGANCPAAYQGDLLGYWVYSPECFEGFTQDELAADDESVVAAAHRDAGIDFATAHAGDWPKVALARLGRTVAVFRPGQLADLGALEGREQAADTAGFALVWASLGLGAVGARRLRRLGNPAWWIPVAAVAAIWASTALSYGNPRFLALAQPSLVALAACGAASLLDRHRARSAP
jgi:hypothetical protein